METNQNRQATKDLDTDPAVDQDAGTLALMALEGGLHSSDERQSEPSTDLTGTERDQTGEDETMATES